MIRVGLIGWGHWGRKLGRNIAASSACELQTVVDLDAGSLADAGDAQSGSTRERLADVVIADPAIDAIVIATPARTHFDLARAALRASKHVLVEKPMTCSSDEARILLDEADRRGLVLMVDHTYLFSGPVRTVRQLVEQQAIGVLHSYESDRLSDGIVRADVNVVWDVASHDIAILDYLMAVQPLAVHAHGRPDDRTGHEHVAHVTMLYEGDFVARIHASWVHSVKTRRLTLSGSCGTVVFDGATADGLTFVPPGRQPRALASDTREALAMVIDEFAAAISERRPMVSDGACGLRVVRILEAIDRSMAHGGAIIELERVGAPA